MDLSSIEETKMTQNGYARERESGNGRVRQQGAVDLVGVGTKLEGGKKQTGWRQKKKRKERERESRHRKRQGARPLCFGALLTSWRSGPSLALATMDYYLILFQS